MGDQFTFLYNYSVVLYKELHAAQIAGKRGRFFSLNDGFVLKKLLYLSRIGYVINESANNCGDEFFTRNIIYPGVSGEIQ